MFQKSLSKEHLGGILLKAFTFNWTVTGGLLKVLMFQRHPSEDILQKISSSYRKVPNVILWKMFQVSHIFQMRNEENTSEYCARQHAITTLSLNVCLNQIWQDFSYLLLLRLDLVCLS